MTKQTADEIADSLTGFDEIAIKQHFGASLTGLATDQSMLARALVFVIKRRDGANDDEARNAALGLALKDVMAHFAEESAESGKGEPVSAPQLVTSPPSAL